LFSLVPSSPDLCCCDDKDDSVGENLPPSFDAAVAKEDVLPHLKAALLTAHVRVSAVRVLRRARALPRAIVPATPPLFVAHLALMDHPR
jgi:hypothetical protein